MGPLSPETKLAQPLLMPALRVLATHAHRIGVEYFQDLTAALARLAGNQGLGVGARVEVLAAVAQARRVGLLLISTIYIGNTVWNVADCVFGMCLVVLGGGGEGGGAGGRGAGEMGWGVGSYQPS